MTDDHTDCGTSHVKPDATRPALSLVVSRPDKLICTGIGRDAEHDKCAVVYFNRPLTDYELRFFHEVCGRTVPLMDAASNSGSRP